MEIIRKRAQIKDNRNAKLNLFAGPCRGGLFYLPIGTSLPFFSCAGVKRACLWMSS